MDGEFLNLNNLSEASEFNDLLAEFNNWVFRSPAKLNCSARMALQQFIDKIDRILSNQLNEIIHQPQFQQLEAAWRGLFYLVSETELGVRLKIWMINVTKRELLKDSERSLEFYQTAFFRLVSMERYYSLGVLIGLYEFGNSPQDIALLESLSKTASALQIPFLSAVSPTLFQMSNFEEFYEVRDFSKIFEQFSYSYYQKWRSIRQSNESNYLGLCLPPILLRESYGQDSNQTKTFNFTEDISQQKKHLWGNPALAFAQRIADSFYLHGWCAEIIGKQNGLVTGLPKTEVRADLNETVKKLSSTEIIVTAEMTRQLTELGFICLTNLLETNDSAFLSARSAHLVNGFENEKASGINGQWTHFHYILTASRLSHHLRQIVIDNWGKFASNDEWQRYLNKWILQLVGSPCSPEKPLAEAIVYVEGIPNYPDKPAKIVSFIKPGYQLPEMVLPIRMEFRHIHDWLLEYERQ